jgi:hypothetical protein
MYEIHKYMHTYINTYMHTNKKHLRKRCGKKRSKVKVVLPSPRAAPNQRDFALHGSNEGLPVVSGVNGLHAPSASVFVLLYQ